MHSCVNSNFLIFIHLSAELLPKIGWRIPSKFGSSRLGNPWSITGHWYLLYCHLLTERVTCLDCLFLEEPKISINLDTLSQYQDIFLVQTIRVGNCCLQNNELCPISAASILKNSHKFRTDSPKPSLRIISCSMNWKWELFLKLFHNKKTFHSTTNYMLAQMGWPSSETVWTEERSQVSISVAHPGLFWDGGANSQSGCVNLFFAKNCMKMKVLTPGGVGHWYPLHPPMYLIGTTLEPENFTFLILS